jgi:hypothetical protein
MLLETRRTASPLTDRSNPAISLCANDAAQDLAWSNVDGLWSLLPLGDIVFN